MRLIDADVFKEYIRESFEEAKGEFQTEKYLKIADSVTEGFLKDIDEQPTVEAKPVEWIPIEWHETTDDDEIDKERYPLYLDCAMPDDAQEIIICRKNGWVNVDTCIYDDGYSLDSGADWIEDVIAWMPLPAPYNADMRKKVE